MKGIDKRNYYAKKENKLHYEYKISFPTNIF